MLAVVIHSSRPDDGRTVIEAVIALAIVAITALGWSRMAIAATRADSVAANRAIALDVATDEIETLRITPSDQLVIDPSSKGAVATFDGLVVVTAAAGLPAIVLGNVGPHEAQVLRLVLDPGSASWRRIVVEVTWFEAGAEHTVRLDTGVPVLAGAGAG